MTAPTKVERARELLNGLAERRDALHAEACQRSGDGTFTIAFGEHVAKELSELTTALGEFRRSFSPDVAEVVSVLGSRLLTVGDYRTRMPNLQIELQPEGPLPFDILEVLERQSPVHEPGVLVKEKHILAWVPVILR